MTIPRRGIQDVRTLSRKVEGGSAPYKVYMQLFCLEMEKFRKGQERDSAMARVNNILARFQEIEVEKARLLQALGEGKRDGSEATGSCGTPRRDTGEFKLRY